jgi:peptidoglycan/LPS O-acetylase OafA/YrhL
MPQTEERRPLLNETIPFLRREMPELDTIRGLAILGVLFYHGLYWQQDLSQLPKIERLIATVMWTGRLGVDLFFVLSGFLITGILSDSRTQPDFYKRFYVRRALRILPAYLAIIAILIVSRYAPASFIILSLLYLSNLTPLLGIPVGYPVLWSLAVEEHFYFLWPLAVRTFRTKQLISTCLVVIFLTPVSRLVSYFLSYKQGFVSYVCNDYTWNALDGLACGAILALLLRVYCIGRAHLFSISCGLFLLAIAIWILGLPYGILTRQTPTGAAMQVVPWHFAFTGLLGLFLLVGTGPWKAIVQIRALRFLGKISYGLYLIHLLVFEVFDHATACYWKYQGAISPFQWLTLRLIFAGGFSVLLAFLSRRYFEEKFLRMKDRLS